MRLFFTLCLFCSSMTIGVAQANETSDSFRCGYHDTSEFGDRIEFEYDRKRNIILLLEHHDGDYKKGFTFGGVAVEDGALNFHFEMWDNGSVAIQESHSLEIGTLALKSARDFYGEDGKFYEAGPRATAQCSEPSAEAAINEIAKPAIATTAQSMKSDTSLSNVKCHTEDFYVRTHDEAGKRTGTWCTNSNLPGNKEHSYGPDQMSSIGGAWCEGEKGHGLGVGVEISYAPSNKDGLPQAFDHLVVANGYDKTTKTFVENSRVKQIEIKTDDGQTWVRSLRDETGLQRVELNKSIQPHGILITILDVFPGRKYEDTCLSFVNAGF